MTFLGGTGALWELTDIADAVSGAQSGDWLFFNGNEWQLYGINHLQDLKARVESLEQRQGYLPTRDDLAEFTQSIAARFNIISEADTNQSNTLDDLVKGFAGMNTRITDVEGLITVHTGDTSMHN